MFPQTLQLLKSLLSTTKQTDQLMLIVQCQEDQMIIYLNPGCPNPLYQIHHQKQCIKIQILESNEVKYNIEMSKSENLFMGSQYWGIKKLSLRESYQKEICQNDFLREVETVVQDEELIEDEDQNILNMVFEYDSNDEWIDMDISEIEKSLSYESS